MSIFRAGRAALGIVAVAALTACATPEVEYESLASVEVDPELQAIALREVAAKHARGQRVWCVPFARDASGIQIRGNANTWWGQAEGLYERGQTPEVGAVMSWKATSRNPRGHIAVVSEIISDRELTVDHANWKRNQVSLKMSVIDVSENNDWSAVKLESVPGSYGRTYPIKGFIYPNTPEPTVAEVEEPKRPGLLRALLPGSAS